MTDNKQPQVLNFWHVKDDPIEHGLKAIGMSFEYAPNEYGHVWIAKELKPEDAILICEAHNSKIHPTEDLEKAAEIFSYKYCKCCNGATSNTCTCEYLANIITRFLRSEQFALAAGKTVNIEEKLNELLNGLLCTKSITIKPDSNSIAEFVRDFLRNTSQVDIDKVLPDDEWINNNAKGRQTPVAINYRKEGMRFIRDEIKQRLQSLQPKDNNEAVDPVELIEWLMCEHGNTYEIVENDEDRNYAFYLVGTGKKLTDSQLYQIYLEEMKPELFKQQAKG